jgi:hypothetical protein
VAVVIIIARFIAPCGREGRGWHDAAIYWLLSLVGVLPASAHITDNIIMVMVKKTVHVKKSMDGEKVWKQ